MQCTSEDVSPHRLSVTRKEAVHFSFTTLSALCGQAWCWVLDAEDVHLAIDTGLPAGTTSKEVQYPWCTGMAQA